MQFDVTVALGDQEISAEDLAQLLHSQEDLVQLKGQWVEVDKERLQQALDLWKSVQKRAKRGEIGFAEGMRLLAGDSFEHAIDDDESEDQGWALVKPDQEFQELLEQLRLPAQRAGADPGLQATLRPYQEVGLGWMRLVTGMGLGACLADDMGLGKTVQVLALLLEKPGPSLLVVPASLLGNWKKEGERFAPGLRMLLAHPSECDKAALDQLSKDPMTTLSDIDLVVTTYSMLGRQSWLQEVRWHTLILDEAQAIKNPSTSQTKAVKKIPSQSRIAMTGTPVENRLGDLWSLFDFLNPGLLGSPSVFKNFLKKLETRPQNKFAPLRCLVGPYILRRKKTDRAIISDLPEKIETPTYCGLGKTQIKLYERVVQSMRHGCRHSSQRFRFDIYTPFRLGIDPLQGVQPFPQSQALTIALNLLKRDFGECPANNSARARARKRLGNDGPFKVERRPNPFMLELDLKVDRLKLRIHTCDNAKLSDEKLGTSALLVGLKSQIYRRHNFSPHLKFRKEPPQEATRHASSMLTK